MKPTRNQIQEIIEYIIDLENKEKALEKSLEPFNNSYVILTLVDMSMKPIRMLLSKELMYELDYFLWDYGVVEVDWVQYDCSWRNIPAFLDYLEKFNYIEKNGYESKLNQEEAWAAS